MPSPSQVHTREEADPAAPAQSECSENRDHSVMERPWRALGMPLERLDC